ncbi:MAG: hypothetical protein ACK56F_12405 [bacterium]
MTLEVIYTFQLPFLSNLRIITIIIFLFCKKSYKFHRNKIILIDIVLFGFKTAFGGGRSTGFCLIYDA